MKKLAQEQKKQESAKVSVEPGSAIYEKSQSETLKEKSVVRQLAADYKELGLHSSGAFFAIAMEIPIVKFAMAKVWSVAKTLAVNIFRKAIGQAAKVSGSAAAESAAGGAAGAAVGVTLAVVFAFIEGYKTGAFISPYVFGDMSNYVTKSKALVRLLEDNMDRKGAETDPKIKALNDEMNKYQMALSGGSYGLSQAAEQHYGGGMRALQEKTPPLTEAKATAKHVKLILDACKDMNSIMSACKEISSEAFKKRFYDVHYVQGSWANPFSQDLNQMQSISGSVLQELSKVAERAADYLAKTFVFGDQLIANASEIFSEEEPKQENKKGASKIMSTYVKVAKILSLYK